MGRASLWFFLACLILPTQQDRPDPPQPDQEQSISLDEGIAAASDELAQSFTAGITGLLKEICVLISSNDTRLVLRILDGAGPGGRELSLQFFTAPSAMSLLTPPTCIPLSPSPDVTQGSVYTFILSVDPRARRTHPHYKYRGSFGSIGCDPYRDGSFWKIDNEQDVVTFLPSQHLAFQTHVECGKAHNGNCPNRSPNRRNSSSCSPSPSESSSPWPSRSQDPVTASPSPLGSPSASPPLDTSPRPPLLATPSSPGCQQFPDINVGGSDLWNLPCSSAEACCAQCSANQGCQAWTWVGPLYKGGYVPQNTCYLKSAFSQPVSVIGMISGKVPAALPPASPSPLPFTPRVCVAKVDRTPPESGGGWTQMSKLTAVTDVACNEACVRSIGCVYWVWSPSAGTCWLSSTMPTMLIYTPDRISGARCEDCVPKMYTDQAGGWTTMVELNTISSSDCNLACVNTAPCVYWIWNIIPGTCWLSSTVPNQFQFNGYLICGARCQVQYSR